MRIFHSVVGSFFGCLLSARRVRSRLEFRVISLLLAAAAARNEVDIASQMIEVHDIEPPQPRRARSTNESKSKTKESLAFLFWAFSLDRESQLQLPPMHTSMNGLSRLNKIAID